MKKELLISARFDTSDFDKSVERMQNRLKDLYAPADIVRAQTQTNNRLASIGMGGERPGISNEQYAKTALQTKRQLDTFIKEEVRDQEKLTKMLVTREAKVKSLQEQQKQTVANSKQELEIKEKIARIEENNFRIKEYYKQREATINQALDARTKVAPRDIPGLIDSFKYGGVAHGMSMIPGAFRQNPWGMGGAAASAGGLALGLGSEMYRDWKGMPIRSEAAFGSAVAGTTGRDVSNIYGRRTAFEQNFQPERQRAAQMAMENAQANRNADRGSLAGNLMAIGGGAATAIGTSFTGIGALAGLGVAAKGAYGLATDERQRSLALSPFSQTSSNRYESLIGEQMSKDYGSTLDAQKSQNPFKTQAVAEYEQNYMRNLMAQRQMGLGDHEMYGAGGFMRNNINAGFTPEMGLEMAGQIQGAGGSTRMQRNSVFGNQMSRNMSLTNAGSILGGLSGSIGSAEGSQQATIKILAEGMKLGLHDSGLVEENRKFTQVAADILSRSGANTDNDFQRNAKNFSSFMGENTNQGIDAAKSAYEQYQSISSTTTGPRGVMRAAGFMKDKYLSQLNTVEKQGLMQLKEEELNSSNPMVAGLAEKVGTTPEDFVSRMRGVNQGSVSRFKEADQIRDRLKSKGLDLSKIGDTQYYSSLSKQDRQDVSELMAFQTTELGNLGQKGNISRLSGTVGKPEMMGPGYGDDAVNASLNAGTGRMGDDTVAAMAGDAGTVLKQFNLMRGEMDAAAKSAAGFTDMVRLLNAQLVQALDDARNGKGSAKDVNGIFQKLMQATGNNVQTQTGKKQGN